MLTCMSNLDDMEGRRRSGAGVAFDSVDGTSSHSTLWLAELTQLTLHYGLDSVAVCCLEKFIVQRGAVLRASVDLNLLGLADSAAINDFGTAEQSTGIAC